MSDICQILKKIYLTFVKGKSLQLIKLTLINDLKYCWKCICVESRDVYFLMICSGN